MAWLKSKLISAYSAKPAPIPEPCECVPDDFAVHRPEVVERLAAELPAPSDAFRYRDNFARLLPQRIQQLTTDVRAQNNEAAVTTLLSLHVGSAMVGAPRLQHVVDRCLKDVRSGCIAACLPTLTREAERFLTHLDELNGVHAATGDAGQKLQR